MRALKFILVVLFGSGLATWVASVSNSIIERVRTTEGENIQMRREVSILSMKLKECEEIKGAMINEVIK